MNETNIIIYNDGELEIDVSIENETIWLTQAQLSDIFEKDQSVISRHINNIFNDNEVDEKSNMQKMHIPNSDKPVSFYSLDIVLAVGYRTNSSKAIKFRQWATKVLKDYLINGYAINQKRLEQKGLKELNETISLLQNTISQGELELTEAKGLLDVILNYSRTWSLLQGYDEDSLHVNIKPREAKFVLDVDEAKEAIAQLKSELMRKGEATELFGNEKTR